MYQSTFGGAIVSYGHFFQVYNIPANSLENEKTKTQKGIFTMISVIHSFIDPLNTYLLDTDYIKLTFACAFLLGTLLPGAA